MMVLKAVALVLPLAATAIRLTEDATDLREHLQSGCTTKWIVDATVCGISTVTQQITDVLACPPKRQCRKVWGRSICVDVPQVCTKNLEQPRNCSVLDKCPVTLSATLTGSGTVTTLSDVSVHAELVNLQIESGHEAAKRFINSHTAFLTPLLNMAADVGLAEVNKAIKSQVGSLRTKLLDTVVDNNIGKYFTVLNPTEANAALRRVLNTTWGSINADIKPRRQLEKAGTRSNWRKRLCHRHLRLRVKGGATYLLENWTNAVFARKFDEKTDCDTVYSAQCAKGIVVKRKQCPFKEDKVKSYCLFGIGCMRRKYRVKSSPTKTVSMALPDGSLDLEVDKEIWVDHVRPDTLRSYTRTGSTKTGTARMLSTEDAAPEDLDDQINMKVPDFEKHVIQDMCSTAGDNSWFPFAGSFRRWRCKAIVRTVCHVARWTGKIPIPGIDDLMIKVSLKKDFTASFIPDWKGIGQLVGDSLVTALSRQKLPMNAKVSKINLALGGSGPHLVVEPESKVYLTADIDVGSIGVPIPVI